MAVLLKNHRSVIQNPVISELGKGPGCVWAVEEDFAKTLKDKMCLKRC